MMRASTTPGISDRLALDRLGDQAGLGLMLARDPDVDRRRLAFIHGAPDHAAGVETEIEVGEPRVAGDPGAERVNVFLRRAGPLGPELDLDDGVHRSRVGGVGGRPVGVDAELGDDQLEVRTDTPADELLDLGNLLLGLLDAGAAGGADVHLEGAGVDFGEELAAEPGAEQADRGDQGHDGQADREHAMVQDGVEPADVPGDRPRDHGFPAGEGATDEAAARGRLLACAGVRAGRLRVVTLHERPRHGS